MAKRGGLKGAELRAFRSKVSQLKKKGLVSSRTDARKQKPTRYMQEKVKRLADLFEGTKTSVKVDKVTAARYKASGYFVFGNRVVVSKDKDERGQVDKSSGLILLTKLGRRVPFEKVVMPFSVKNIEAFMSAASKAPPDPQIFAAKKNPQDHWAFTYRGHNSLSTFADIGLMGEYLERYISLNDDPREFQNLILYRVVPEFWVMQTYKNIENRKRENRRRFARDRKDDRRKTDNLVLRGREKMQAKVETYNEMNARHQREFRERQRALMKGNAQAMEAQRLAWAKAKQAQRKAKKAK